jgi:integrase
LAGIPRGIAELLRISAQEQSALQLPLSQCNGTRGTVNKFDAEYRTGDTKTAARQEGVPIIPYLQKITDKYWKTVGCPAEGAVFGRWMNNLKRDHITPTVKEKGDGTPFAVAWRGLATNLHEMGVPTKVIQRVCRHADEATTKKHYIYATEPVCGAACESWKRR